ncbi:hypothetical protein [Pseudomarimonas arenosa]|uniref:Peptidase M61 catalytic domain-containing protein n=1 Tax=Pseudomarimonas arenosa TaxID=2774145 RepID=A0AAW3ZHM5_9GAMM|nr:hypothetical protein [Pseudomarimonas arenosa]MBD8524249.1 hypothetical protein [Pseudomarimonas arenosa]
MRWIGILILQCCGLTVQAAPPIEYEVQLRFVQGEARLALDACATAAAERIDWQAPAGQMADIVALRRSSGAALVWRGERVQTLEVQAGECLHWLIDLQAIAERDRWGLGYRSDRYYRAPIAAWLWRPSEFSDRDRLRFAAADGWAISAPWPAANDGWRVLGATPQDWPGTVAWFVGQEQRVMVPGGELRVSVLPSVDTPPPGLREWMQRTADNLLTSAPRWPSGSTQVVLLPLPGVRSPVPWGQVTRGGGSAVHLFLGAAVEPTARASDWTATHEMAHLLHPFMGDRGRWLAEGLASYYQNVARSRSGELSEVEAWSRLRAGFERGQAATPAGAPTLNEVSRRRTRGSTMRVYWSGAAFWLQTDLALRSAGYSLDQALAGFAERHLPSTRLWRPEAFVRALGEHVSEAERDALQTRFSAYQARTDFPALPELLRQAPDDGPPPAVVAILRPAEHALCMGTEARPLAPPSAPGAKDEC